uniref:Uncharacterized protein n=1 Tax=Anguilla anguilla TaxID=7936 RepID=A0A0E9TLD7_ANGAN
MAVSLSHCYNFPHTHFFQNNFVNQCFFF